MEKRYEVKINGEKVTVYDNYIETYYYGRLENGRVRANDSLSMTQIVKALRQENLK